MLISITDKRICIIIYIDNCMIKTKNIKKLQLFQKHIYLLCQQLSVGVPYILVLKRLVIRPIPFPIAILALEINSDISSSKW